MAAGALAARPVPVAVAAALSAVALSLRRPALLCLGAALLASGLAARSWAGLAPPVAGDVAGIAVLVSDPDNHPGGVSALIRLDGRRVEARASGALAAPLRARLAGETVALRGRLVPLSAEMRARMAHRHVAARLDVSAVGAGTAGDGLSAAANRMRRVLDRGASSMPDRHRGLFGGFVLGDDRGQDDDTVDDFRRSGLSHLLVVSGQNVAFVLALAGPLVRRGPLGARVGWTLALLGLFGILTRWEPSVLRAITMAGVTALAHARARPVSRLRALALAVTLLLLVDPLLVGSLGFLLSVSACAGIALLAAPIEQRLPGPRPLRSALGITAGAQAGVSPVLALAFSGVPVASIPANLLASPAAGPLMVWGVAAGVPAGLIGGDAARLLHLPTRVMIGWVDGVARMWSSAPLGTLGAGPLLVVAAIGSVLCAWSWARRPTTSRTGPS